jgi:hypothetical protein
MEWVPIDEPKNYDPNEGRRFRRFFAEDEKHFIYDTVTKKALYLENIIPSWIVFNDAEFNNAYIICETPHAIELVVEMWQMGINKE